MIEKFKNAFISSYKERLEDLLSFCDSPIVQIMLLSFLNYFNINRDGAFPKEGFSDIIFLEDIFSTSDFGDSDPIENEELNRKIIKHNYRLVGVDYRKIIGFKVSQTGCESELQIRGFPEKEICFDTNTYRIDIALIFEIWHYEKKLIGENFYEINHNKKTLFQSERIAIECDGHDFHSTREQITKDNIRSRKLESEGWKVLRYSGSEIAKFR